MADKQNPQNSGQNSGKGPQQNSQQDSNQASQQNTHQDSQQNANGGSLKIVVNRDLCIGAAPCVAIAGSVFQLDDEGKAIIIDPAGADEETIRLAAEACPVRAILLYKKDSDEQIYP